MRTHFFIDNPTAVIMDEPIFAAAPKPPQEKVALQRFGNDSLDARSPH